MVEGLTPVQRCMLETLSDGMSHTRYELFNCLADELGELSNIQPHLTALRKAVQHKGLGIRCEILAKETSYRLVRLLGNSGADYEP